MTSTIASPTAAGPASTTTTATTAATPHAQRQPLPTQPRKFQKSKVTMSTIFGGTLDLPLWHSNEPPKLSHLPKPKYSSYQSITSKVVQRSPPQTSKKNQALVLKAALLQASATTTTTGESTASTSSATLPLLHKLIHEKAKEKAHPVEPLLPDPGQASPPPHTAEQAEKGALVPTQDTLPHSSPSVITE